MDIRRDKPDQAIAKLLAMRYGDGLVYMTRNAGTTVFRDAIDRGFISADGIMTSKGRSLLAKAGAPDLRG